jgi:hypothetical protein
MLLLQHALTGHAILNLVASCMLWQAGLEILTVVVYLKILSVWDVMLDK